MLHGTLAEDPNMASGRLGRGGWIAVGLAVFGGVVALINEWMAYRRSGTVDWGHVALAVGVPSLMYAIVRSTSGRRD